MKSVEHDLVVIGSGPGGYVSAIRAAQLGLNVACIEKESALGGTCLRVGCIPSKALLESSEQYHRIKHETELHGISVKDVSFDLSAMMKRKINIVNELTQGIAGLFKKNKITHYTGTATITEPGHIVVKANEDIELIAKNTLIATGSSPVELPGIEQDGILIGDSTTGLSFDTVPDHLVVIGAGYIGMELGSVWRRLGSEVTVLEYLDRVLPGADSEISREAMRLFKQQGFKFHFKTKVTAAKAVKKGKNKKCLVEAEGLDPIECDRVLVVAGRRPNTDGLGLENVDVRTDDRGFIQVDQHYWTGVEGIYAIGDVIGGMMLAHKASDEGIACVEGIYEGYGHVNYRAIPAVVFTDPEIASVGQTEDQLKEAGVSYNKGVFMFRAIGRAKALNKTDGRVKVLADKETDKLLGVHIIGPHAGELISECALAMEFGANSEDIARTCHTHPTLSECVMEASLNACGKAIHS